MKDQNNLILVTDKRHSIFEILELVEGISGKKFSKFQTAEDPPKLVVIVSIETIRWQPSLTLADHSSA